MNPETRRTARLWLALVFLLGTAVGVVFGYTFGHRSYAATTVTAPSLSEPERRAKRVADMTKQMNLSAEQAAKVDEIIRNAHEEMGTIRKQADKDVDGVREKARDQIRQFLTPEQKPKFEEMIQKNDEERKKQAAAGKS